MLAEGLEHPEGPVVVGDDIFFVEECRGTVSVLSNGTIFTFAHLGGSPNGLAVHGRTLFVAQNGGVVGNWRAPARVPASILTVDLETGQVSTLLDEVEGVPVSAPNDLIVDAEGRVIFTDPGFFEPASAGRICRYDAGIATVLVKTGPNYPNGLLIDDAGTLWWAETRRRAIVRDSLRREDVSVFAEPALPDGMTLLPDGRIGVASVTSNGLHLLDPATGRAKFLTWTGAGFPTNLMVINESLIVTDAGTWPAHPRDGKIWKIDDY